MPSLIKKAVESGSFAAWRALSAEEQEALQGAAVAEVGQRAGCPVPFDGGVPGEFTKSQKVGFAIDEDPTGALDLPDLEED